MDCRHSWVADPWYQDSGNLAKYNNGTDLRSLYAIHAPSKQYTSEALLKKKMITHLMKGFNVTNVEFLNTIGWPYFPR